MLLLMVAAKVELPVDGLAVGHQKPALGQSLSSPRVLAADSATIHFHPKELVAELGEEGPNGRNLAPSTSLTTPFEHELASPTNLNSTKVQGAIDH